MSDDTSDYIHTLVAMRFDVAKTPITREYQAQIEVYKKELSQLSLPEIRAEYLRAELVKLRFGKPEYTLSESELAEKGHFEERLSKLPPSELVRYESASEDETVKNLVEAHRLRALTPELSASYFGEPPEYVRWGALDCWTRGEAISLTIGLDPKVDLFSERHDVFAPSKSSSKVEQALHALKMTREEAWKQISDFGYPTDPTMGFDEDTEEVLRKWTFTDAAAEYIQLQDRIERAIDAGKLGERITPAGYIHWARDSGIPVPDELKQAVEARNEIPNWKARYDDLLKQFEAVSDERDGLRRELDQMRSTQDAKAGRDTITPRERTTVKRLIIGMAVKGYRYNPKAGRNEATKDIADDLDRLGISLDVDTVRKWLQESAEELKPDWDQKDRS